jgi:hypothetical protein
VTGCRAVRACPTPQATADWSASAARQATADLGPCAARCDHRLDYRYSARLVWRGRARGGDHVGHGGVVSLRDTPLPIRWLLVRDPHGEFDSQAVLCTDVTVDPIQILEWFVLRWRLAVTWQEARAH